MTTLMNIQRANWIKSFFFKGYNVVTQIVGDEKFMVQGQFLSRVRLAWI